MKALIIAPYYAPAIGGLENYARQLNKALAEQEDWDIVVITSQKGLRQTQGYIDGMRIYRLGTWIKVSNTPLNPLWPLIIHRIVKQEKPDVILAHTPVPSLADAAALAKGTVPLVVISHAATLLKQGSPLFNIVARVYNVFGVYTFRRANRIFAVSDYVKQQLQPSLQAKTTIVPNAVWQHDIRARKQPSRVEFIFIGSLARSHAWKGVRQIIEAMSIYSQRYGNDFNLTIVGDGNMRASYERLASDLGIVDHVRFVGAQVGEAKVRYLQNAQAMVVYPVTENDAFPTVMLEAWAQSVPVVAARLGCIATLVHDGEDGYLCAPKAPAELAEKLHQLTLAPTEARTKVARAAAKLVADRYTWERQAKLVSSEVGKLL